ncbi:MAG TPA: hypothetical protein GXX64_04390 [Bacteroidales bacterium]|nr:hypothetical protein [Bacteroidales bacterium]
MIYNRLPMIFIFSFSKSPNKSKSKWTRLLLMLFDLFLIATWVFLIVQLSEAETRSDLVLSPALTNILLALFFVLSFHCFDAILVAWKDWDDAIIALKVWNKIKTRGKSRFMLGWFIFELVVIASIISIYAGASIRLGANITSLVIGGLISIALMWVFIYSVWQLNIKYEDRIETQLWQIHAETRDREILPEQNLMQD